MSVIATVVLIECSQDYYSKYLIEKVAQVYGGYLLKSFSIGKQTEEKIPSSIVQVREAPRTSEENFVWNELLGEWTISRYGDTQPEHGTNFSCLWPDDECRGNVKDRIVDQLRLRQQTDTIYKIFPHDLYSFSEGQALFSRENCPVDRCQITHDHDEADVLVFQNSDVFYEPAKWRRKDQVWIAYLLESPVHTFDKKFKRKHRGNHEFNWTATYRADSDIVAPYSKFVPYEDQLDRYNLLKRTRAPLTDARDADTTRKHMEEVYALTSSHQRSLIRGKKGKVAWLASNCNAANNRLEYARELSEFIQVDIYGR